MAASRALQALAKRGSDTRAQRKAGRERRHRYWARDVARYCERLIETIDPLRERLVLFWTDHFAVSAAKGAVRLAAGPMVEEAIAPRVYGRFADLLRAAVLHPAMLYYLDARASVGPNSPIGRRRGFGLNENLAREVLELHTMGVGSGYTQDDVVALARILTGVKLDRNTGLSGFRPAMAEPGKHRVVDRAFSVQSMDDVHVALDHLATLPATARHITGKLVDHFVGPHRAPDLRRALADAFVRSGGDLAVVTRTLITHEDAWQLPLENVRPPLDFVVATARLAGPAFPAPVREDRPRPGDRFARGRFVSQLSRSMGQRVWQPPSPAGFPANAEFWLSAAGLSARLDWAGRLSRRLVRTGEPLDVLERALGPVASGRTRTVVSRAPNARTAIALVVGSPEFNMR